MQVALENLEGLERKLTVTVPGNRLREDYDKRIAKMSREIKLKGYRPGKVPPKLVEQRYGKDVWKEIASDKMRRTLHEVLTEKKIRPASAPSITRFEADFNRDMTFTAELEALPALELKPFSDVKLDKATSAVDDKAVTEAIERVREQHPDWQEIDRPAKKDDRVTVSFRGFQAGKPLKKSTATETPLIIGQHLMPADFEQALEGCRAGDDKTVSVAYPQRHPNKDVAGKTVEFKVEVHKVETPKLPELDEEFIGKLGIQGGEQALRKEVETALNRELAQALANLNKRRVVAEILALHRDIELPKSLLKIEMDTLSRQLDEAERKKRHEDLTREAEKRVILGLVIGEYANHYNISADPARVRRLLSALTAAHPQPRKMIDWYHAEPQRLKPMQWLALEEQVAEKLMSVAQTSEKKLTYDEVMRERD